MSDIGKLEFCEHCVFGKQKRVSFSTVTHDTKGILDYIHYDLWGRSKVPSLGGCEYMITFIDDFSRKVWVYFLKHKNDLGIYELESFGRKSNWQKDQET